MVANQTVCLRLELRSVIKCLWQKNANHVKFTEECVMYLEEYVLLKNIWTDGLNTGLPLRAWVKKTVSGVVITIEYHVYSLLGHERTHYNRFPWKRCNRNQCFLRPSSWAKFTLFIEWPRIIIIIIGLVDRVFANGPRHAKDFENGTWYLFA